jgi:glycosyltransferase involved in cell wall biosynthesis
VPPRPYLVVIPALNEEASVGQVIGAVRATLPDAHVVVVDDGSTDLTRDIARAAGAEVISLPFNVGVGAALRAGFRFALRFGYDTVVQVDGDGQHDPSEVPRLLAELPEADVVIGARFAGAGDYHVRGARRLAIRLLARSLSKRTGVKLTDTTSGFRAFNRRAVEVFARDYPAEYLGDTVEALVIASKARLRVTQVPVRMQPRIGGSPSQSRIRSAMYLGRVLLAIAMSPLRR